MDEMIDEAAYNEGRADFDNGVSLRQLVDHATRFGRDDVKSRSIVVGFCDALLECVRQVTRPPRIVVEQSDGTVMLIADVPLLNGTVRGERPGDVFK